MQNGRTGDPKALAGRRGWSLRAYTALVIAALTVVAGAAALFVRVQSEQDAWQAAIADSNFASQKVAKQLNAGFEAIAALSTPLATAPSVAQLFTNPAGCSIGYAPIAPFDTGHIDIVRLDGSVVCTSRGPVGAGTSPTYQGQTWLQAKAPVVVAPLLDPATGNQVAVIAYPIAGKGAFVWFLDLTPLGPKFASEFGSGTHQLEFVIASTDGQAIVARSIESARWVGRTLDGTAFADSGALGSRPDFDGTQRIYGRSSTNTAGWHIYVGADEAAALSAADQLANRDLAIIVSGLAVVLTLMLVLYLRIADPIRLLSLRVRSAATGDLVAGAAAGAGAKEVGTLADDFDRLMATIKRELEDRLNNEQAAVVSERNYRMLFEGHPQPMWLYDVHTLAFLNVNDAAVERYGYSRDEFLAMTLKDIRPPQDVPKFLELNTNPLPNFDRTGPWRHRLKDRTTVEVLITSHAVTFDGHEARLVLAEDLTESQRLELELHQSQARAEANAELSRAKDEMVSMVSHEMRTPLASIVGFTELLVTRDVKPEKRKEYLAIMLQEGRRLTTLINNFLDLRRIESGQLTMRFAPADISALIKRAVDLASSGSGGEFETHIQDNLPLVRVDSDSIFQALANLLSNARKYSPDGGLIVVGATVVDDMVEVYVQDHGLGIPREALPHLFRKFYRVDTADRHGIKGTGLGLAISKDILEAHGGKIGVVSEGPGLGSRFVFTVPLAREHAQNGDVLIVEDDSGFAHLLEAELAGRGLSSIWAADAETAELLMTQKRARAIVLDLLLPGLPGEAFLQRLRKTHGVGIPVVVITMKDLSSEESLSLQKAGVTAVLRKGPGMAETAATLIAKVMAPELVAS